MKLSLDLFPIDILKLIYEKKITTKEADEIVSYWRDNHIVRTLDEYRNGLFFSKKESNAFNIGLIKQLASWRYEGWPKNCALCKKAMNFDKWGLMYRKVGNRIKLTHINCSEDYLRMLGYTPLELGYPEDTKVKKVTKKEMKELKEKFKFVLWDQLEPITEKEKKKLKKKIEKGKKVRNK